MEQLLLLTFTESNRKAVKMGNTKEETSLEWKEMKNYLEAASTDLLQPRPEAIQQILKRSRQ